MLSAISDKSLPSQSNHIATWQNSFFVSVLNLIILYHHQLIEQESNFSKKLTRMKLTIAQHSFWMNGPWHAASQHVEISDDEMSSSLIARREDLQTGLYFWDRLVTNYILTNFIGRLWDNGSCHLPFFPTLSIYVLATFSRLIKREIEECSDFKVDPRSRSLDCWKR